MKLDNSNASSMLRILLVEDNEHDRAAFRRSFKKAEGSYEIVEFERAEEALATLSANPPQFDILVTGYMLPGMNGMELCRELLKKRITIPMVLLAGTGSEQIAVEALKSGVYDYIVKDPDQGYLKLLPVVVPEVVRKYGDRITHKETEDKLTGFMDSTTDGFSLLDRDLNFQYMNPAALKMFGVKLENIVGMNASDFNPAFKESGRYAAYMKVIETGQPYFTEDVSLHEKFGDIHLSVRAFKVGTGLGLMSINLTEHKRVEQQKDLKTRILDTINRSAVWKEGIEEIINDIKEFTGFEAVAIRLREGEDFPYYVTQGFPGHFVEAERYLCTRDSNGEITRDSEGNPYVECMCGNVICGRTDPEKDFFTEGGSFWSNNTSKLLSETTDEDRQARTRNRCNSEGYESVALVPLKAGNEIYGLIQLNDTRTNRFTEDAILYFEELGASIGIAVSRKVAEEALKNEKLLSDDYINSLPGLFYVFDEKRFVRWNIEWNMITGYSDEELSGMYVTDFFEGEDRTLIGKQMLKVFREGVAEAEAKLVTKDGRDISYYFTGIRKKLGGKDHLIGLGIDITGRKKLETQLQQSQKMEAIATLAGGIAHQFNNSLMPITANIDMLEMDFADDKNLKNYTRQMKGSAERMAMLTDQLLAYAKGGKYQPGILSVSDFVRDTLPLIRHTIGTAVQVDTDIPHDVFRIEADRTQMQMVLSAVLINASEAMEGRGSVRVYLQK